MKKVNIYDVVRGGGFDGGRIVYNKWFREFADNMNEIFSIMTINKKGHLVLLDENGKLKLDVNQFIIDSNKPKPEPEPQPPTPVEEKNTTAQNTTASNVVSTLLTGDKNITIPEGETLKNITIPETVTVAPVISGEIANNAHIIMDSVQNLTIKSTTETPIDIHVEMSETKTLTLQGNFNNIFVDGKGFTTSSYQATPVQVSGTVVITAPEGTAMNATADWVGQKCEIYTETVGTLNVGNFNPDGTEIINVYAPNATVTMSNGFDEVTATVSEDTLILNASFYANKLTMKQGNIIYKSPEITDLVKEVVTKGKVEPYTVEGLKFTNGICNLMEDTVGNRIGAGISASGKFRWNLNGHTYTAKNENFFIAMLRGKSTLDIYGPGKMTTTGAGSYGIWCSSADSTINLHDGDYEGYEHTIYAENGVINIYGGTYKLLNADTADRDANGLLKFLLNCYDSNYTAGTAKINVYGGKFYEFNPAESYGEPSGPISFVAEGYKVVETTEDGKRVFEVVKK